jgi:hypothetical protein
MNITASASVLIPLAGSRNLKIKLYYFRFRLPETVYILVSEFHNNRKNLFDASLDVPIGMRLMPL